LSGQNRKDIHPGLEVDIVLKKDQRSGRLTRGRVQTVLTRSAHHPHGIKVRLTDGQIGRVRSIVSDACDPAKGTAADAAGRKKPD
jgi:uncharacterized repeat protein (TIGR03833 family)